MIPKLSHAPSSHPGIPNFLDLLRKNGFSGDITDRYAERLTMAVDNSIYQLLPDALLFPRSIADLLIITRLANQPVFKELVFVPRGGGTGTNGQSLNQAIVIDLSRYMKRIIEVNPEQGWVRVEAGVVKDQLNQWLKPYGYFFAPELSTSNRATIGGMINTDASGQGSLVYGKTSDHVLELRAVLIDGEIIDTRAVSIELAEQLAEMGGREGELYRDLIALGRESREQVLEHFPKLNRFLTGYDLRHLFNDDMTQCDLGRLICGSEGTLALVAEAKLNILPLPAVRQLVNIKYDSFDSALRNAPFLVEAKALSVETVDSKVLNLAREDIIWYSVNELITEVPGQQLQGLNLVEFAGDDLGLIEQQVQALCKRLDQLMAQGEAGIIGYQRCTSLSEVERIYAMRKKAVGLLGSVKGSAKPLPFVEDTAVPPESLADYIVEFRQLLDQHQLDYGMFGHVDAGVLHVRPALDLCDPDQEKLIKTITDQVVELTGRYGGLLWGEHGKGLRGYYSEAFFGAQLYHQLRRVKTFFDKDNRLNPGKICTPINRDDQLKPLVSPTRGSFDRQIAIEVRDEWRGAIECNGNGLCFNFDVNSPMCPSMKVTANRLHSPKGRATLIREWLRLLSEQGVKPSTLDSSNLGQTTSLRTLLQRTKNSWRSWRGEYDFSHEVKESMSGCLACKACSTQCPIKIDVPNFRAKFLQVYHSRYLRPISDHLVGQVERYAPLMAKTPKLSNALFNQPWIKKIVRQTVGMVDLPMLSIPTLAQRLAHQPSVNLSVEQIRLLPASQREKVVLVVQDPFTTFYEANLVTDFVSIIQRLGYRPVVLPFVPNGKPQHVKGFLTAFAKTAQNSADFFNQLQDLNLPLVGTDPALVLCYRDEYHQSLGEQRGDFSILLAHEWLIEAVKDQPARTLSEDKPWTLLAHCTESTQLPNANQQWQQIFHHMGARLDTLKLGCCGMAGTYGHETQQLANSIGIYQLSWQPQLAKHDIKRCLATGFSCRSQVKRFEQQALRHPLQALLSLLDKA